MGGMGAGIVRAGGGVAGMWLGRVGGGFGDDRGEDHLGVALGRNVLVMAAEGSLHIGLDHPGLVCAWRVG